jgi:hypothetical protein
MPRIWVDKQTGIQLAMKSWWIIGTLFGSNSLCGVFGCGNPVENLDGWGCLSSALVIITESLERRSGFSGCTQPAAPLDRNQVVALRELRPRGLTSSSVRSVVASGQFPFNAT